MKVLISPTSIDEALSILDAPIDILDVKNVNEGSLGAQFPWNIRRVVEAARPHGMKTSATLGDLPYKPGTAAQAAYGVAELGVTYIKAGLHGATTYEQAREMMDAIRQAVRMVSDKIDVVASGYADYRRFGGLNTTDLVRAARDAQCDLVMVDTAIKDGKTLFDALEMSELREFVSSGQEAGMQVALAGSLKFEDAELLFDINPDVIGVRGAVCAGPDRKSQICPNKTRDFVDLFHAGVTESKN